ncbi:unnamed protein product [Amoebophrya sp. A120]|nr:unnamed protein product [Amoebophrya sp. A120]|eukprot:GSA120T00007986001.1
MGADVEDEEGHTRKMNSGTSGTCDPTSATGGPTLLQDDITTNRHPHGGTTTSPTQQLFSSTVRKSRNSLFCPAPVAEEETGASSSRRGSSAVSTPAGATSTSAGRRVSSMNKPSLAAPGAPPPPRMTLPAPSPHGGQPELHSANLPESVWSMSRRLSQVVLSTKRPSMIVPRRKSQLPVNVNGSSEEIFQQADQHQAATGCSSSRPGKMNKNVFQVVDNSSKPSKIELGPSERATAASTYSGSTWQPGPHAVNNSVESKLRRPSSILKTSTSKRTTIAGGPGFFAEKFALDSNASVEGSIDENTARNSGNRGGILAGGVSSSFSGGGEIQHSTSTTTSNADKTKPPGTTTTASKKVRASFAVPEQIPGFNNRSKRKISLLPQNTKSQLDPSTRRTIAVAPDHATLLRHAQATKNENAIFQLGLASFRESLPEGSSLGEEEDKLTSKLFISPEQNNQQNNNSVLSSPAPSTPQSGVRLSVLLDGVLKSKEQKDGNKVRKSVAILPGHSEEGDENGGGGASSSNTKRNFLLAGGDMKKGNNLRGRAMPRLSIFAEFKADNTVMSAVRKKSLLSGININANTAGALGSAGPAAGTGAIGMNHGLKSALKNKGFNRSMSISIKDEEDARQQKVKAECSKAALAQMKRWLLNSMNRTFVQDIWQGCKLLNPLDKTLIIQERSKKIKKVTEKRVAPLRSSLKKDNSLGSRASANINGGTSSAAGATSNAGGSLVSSAANRNSSTGGLLNSNSNNSSNLPSPTSNSQYYLQNKFTSSATLSNNSTPTSAMLSTRWMNGHGTNGTRRSSNMTNSSIGSFGGGKGAVPGSSGFAGLVPG